MLEQFLKALGSEFTFTQSSVILLMIYLLFQERKEKKETQERLHECVKERTKDAKESALLHKQSTDRVSDSIRTLDRMLYKNTPSVEGD